MVWPTLGSRTAKEQNSLSVYSRLSYLRNNTGREALFLRHSVSYAVAVVRAWPRTQLKYRLYNYPSRALPSSAAAAIIKRAFQVRMDGNVYQPIKKLAHTLLPSVGFRS